MNWNDLKSNENVFYVDNDELYQNLLEEVISNPYEFLQSFRMPAKFTGVTFVRFTTQKTPEIKRLHNKVQEITTVNVKDLIGTNILAVYFEDGEPDKRTFQNIYRRMVSRFQTDAQIYIRK